MAKKKIVSKIEDKKAAEAFAKKVEGKSFSETCDMIDPGHKEDLTMSQKGLSDSTTTINVDAVRASKEELTEQIKSDPAVPAGMFGGSSIVEEQLMANDEGEFAIKGSPATESAPETITTDSGIENTPSPEINPEAKPEQPEPLTNEELTQLYMQQGLLNNQLIERQYILEWRVFGKEFKGKYTYLQIDKGMFIFGTSVEDVKYISAETPKDAFAKYLEIS